MPSPGYIPGKLVIPNTVQIRLIWTLPNGVQASNVLHALVAEDYNVTRTGCNDLITAISAQTETTAYFALLCVTTALQRIEMKDLRLEDQAIAESDFGAIPGTGAGSALPEEVALVVSLRTALAGRAHRGRTYLCGFIAGTLTAEGHATGALTLAAQDWMSANKTSMQILGLGMAVGHRGHAEYLNAKGVTVPAEAPGSDLVTQVVCRDAVFDSQRRRK